MSVCLSLYQTRDALLKILEDIKEEDYLNFILFSDDVTTWKDTLVQATPENIQEARVFVKNIRDRGRKNRGASHILTAPPSDRAACFLPPWGTGFAGQAGTPWLGVEVGVG